MATYSSIPAWRIPRDRGTWWATIHGDCKESDTAERLSTNTSGEERDKKGFQSNGDVLFLKLDNEYRDDLLPLFKIHVCIYIITHILLFT